MDESARYIRLDEVNAASEELTASPVAGGEDFTIICSWCSFLCHLGRGPVKHQLCNLCKLDMEKFPEVASA